MPETRVEDVPQLRSFSGHLINLGYATVSQFTSVAHASPKALSAYLGLSEQNLTQLIAAVSPPSAIAAAAAAVAAPPPMPLGGRLDRIGPPAVALMRAPGLTANLPASINMIQDMNAVRNQGAVRGTCVAHACAAAAEHYFRIQAGQILSLSPQFLYWDCKRNDGDPQNPGTWIFVAMGRLASDGCCLDSVWSYNLNPMPGNEGQDPPPPNAMADALNHVIPSYQQLAPTSVPDIKGELAAGRCVAFTVPVFDSWYHNDNVILNGDIINPIPGEANVGAHAMCLVGYKDDDTDTASGGGRFILRNSWGSTWATQSTSGTAGYGSIPYSYINACGVEAFSVGA